MASNLFINDEGEAELVSEAASSAGQSVESLNDKIRNKKEN